MDTSISSTTLNYILISHLLKNSLLFAILTEKRHFLIIASIKDNFIKMRGGIGLLKHQQKKTNTSKCWFRKNRDFIN